MVAEDGVGDTPEAPRSGGVDPVELAAFLASAPEGLKGWADEQLARLDAPADAAVPVETLDDAVDIEAFADELDHGPIAAAGPAKPGAKPSKVNLVLVTLLVAAVVIIVQQMGRPASHPDTTPTSMPSSSAAAPTAMNTYPPLDTESEAELKAKLEADPSDVTARQELAERYLASGLFQDAIKHLAIILDADPDNLDALLAIGVAEFNTGEDALAETHWVRATEVAPDQPEPYYNLGFLYMAKTPPDYEAVERVWGKVIELAPDSELAATARAHLDRLRAQKPSASPTPER